MLNQSFLSCKLEKSQKVFVQSYELLMARVFFRSVATLLQSKTSSPRMLAHGIELPESFSPPVNRSMQELDRSFFKKSIPISALTVFDPRHIQNVKTVLNRTHESLHIKGVDPVLPDELHPKARRLLLMPGVKAEDPKTWSAQLNELVSGEVGEIRPYQLELSYDNWSMSEILEATLPEIPEDEKETPAGFAPVGHVAHLNLRDAYLPHKYLIAQVLADKNHNIKTVINKLLDVGSHSEFRTFPYEVLVGPNDLNVSTSHEGCTLEFDFGKVYYNPRLQTEHRRIISKFKPGEAVCDVMAGVGPFALPAGKKKAFVRANDLNPECYKALEHNIKRNKASSFVQASCLDGRTFIREETRRLQKDRREYTEPLPKQSRNAAKTTPRPKSPTTIREPASFDHYVMNLPATAVEFLDAFKGVYEGREQEFTPHTDRKLPTIHVYTFQRRCTPEQEIIEVCENVSKHIGAEIKPDDQDLEVEIFNVRLVAPKKLMYCASFRIPPSVAFAKSTT